jgi:hypothetical protein
MIGFIDVLSYCTNGCTNKIGPIYLAIADRQQPCPRVVAAI